MSGFYKDPPRTWPANRYNPAGRGLGEIPRVELEARLVAAERERDEAARFGEATQDWLRQRVATLEAALREWQEAYWAKVPSTEWIRRLNVADDLTTAVLGDQEAPTEPRFVWCIECDSTTVGVHREGCEEAPTEPPLKRSVWMTDLGLIPPAAPQVAPEPDPWEQAWEQRDEWRVVDDEGLVCCTEIDDLDDAHGTAEMLDRDNPPDRHHVEQLWVLWLPVMPRTAPEESSADSPDDEIERTRRAAIAAGVSPVQATLDALDSHYPPAGGEQTP